MIRMRAEVSGAGDEPGAGIEGTNGTSPSSKGSSYVEPCPPRGWAIGDARRVRRRAFFAMARLGEFTAGSADEEFIAERHLAVANSRRIDATSEAPLRYELDLPFDKVRRRVGRTLVVSARDGEPFCPVGGIDNHFRLNDPPPARLFPYRAREGGHRQLTSSESAFSRRIKDILEASGRAPLNNHSFRSGGATFYLREGVHTDHIRTLALKIAIQVLSKAGKLALDLVRA
ncbi:BZ3500_MvSof-1268-A1-R1_Chr8-2g10212 [Microbotryum saponariae]|uniref:BZ3500_MvSof-1268-A1-R1_Chr8-2g10212 protein n=1 Tax=Microbotryum saponariae TaxID=289078 RepID=A0A2X0LAD1_9BASI|nr:BZ3500_MvSof-1268-A1-R1_Chr8-2g10212 [Microbotryum saponariae]SDA02010.1 BZ3501_MvSof-1269-A2-R1_Chr8-2g09962 [Microbotryum saponariae]